MNATENMSWKSVMPEEYKCNHAYITIYISARFSVDISPEIQYHVDVGPREYYTGKIRRSNQDNKEYKQIALSLIGLNYGISSDTFQNLLNSPNLPPKPNLESLMFTKQT